MSLKLLKCLLTKEFYDKYKHKLSPELFVADNNTKNLFNTLSRAFETIKTDLTVDSLRELHYSYNPVLSDSNKKVFEDLFTNLKSLEITVETSEVILKQAIEQYQWTKLGHIAIDGGMGHSADITTAQELLDEIREGTVLDRTNFTVTDSIDELLEETAGQQKWKFPLTALRDRLEGIGPTTFTLIAARPNVGKTGLVSAFIAQPEGFIDQGAHVTYVGNEESARRTKIRMMASYTGITEKEMRDGRKGEAEEIFASVKEYLHILDVSGFSIEELERYLKEERHPTDILVVDVLDKLTIGGNYDQEQARLARIYMRYREIGKEFNTANIGTSQANFEAENKDIFGMECLANSRTGKGGELDVCLCLGRKLKDGEIDSGNRGLNIPKNKLSGVEDYLYFNMDFKLTRAVG